jgi:myo-inositol-1(or 4)-monophosphatase
VADAAALLALARSLALEAGALVLEGRRGGLRQVATKSSGTDMVTEYDRASEALIVGGLRAARDDDGIVAEEGGHHPGTSGIDWLVDPIDGTTNYLYDLAPYAVSIAARDGAGPLVGVVHVPPLAETYTAVRGGGAFLDDRPISCSDHPEVATALVATGFAYDPERRRRQAGVLTQVLGQVRDVRRLGAASVDLCHVACGRVDAYFEVGLAPWDLAAGGLIAVEAGARLGSLDHGPLGAGSVLAAGPALYDALAALLATAGAASV